MSVPLVSVVMANFNGARFLEPAIRSVLGQDMRELELILVDDASTDDSIARATVLAQRDPRLRIERMGSNQGPGAARNHALDLARGRWLAVVDSDDLIHPNRLSRLLARAQDDEADIVADDLLVFAEDIPGRADRFLGPRRSREPTWLTAEEFLLETRLYAGGPDLGFLKPMIRLEAWRRSGVRYDEGLPIGEDHDLLLRLLAAGLPCRIDPFLGYFYRKHAGSTSHRLGTNAMAKIGEAEARYRADLSPASPALQRAMDLRRESIRTAEAFTLAIDDLKARRVIPAARRLFARPQAAMLFRMPLASVGGRLLDRLLPARTRESSGAPKVCFISRQRLVGRTNGSSAYLLDLARAARRAGFEPHLLQPSPVVLGRWPVLRLKPEMWVFESIAIRGVFRLGPLVIARDPAVYTAAAVAVLARVLRRVGVNWPEDVALPWSVSTPWTDRDRVFVARKGRDRADVIFAEYVWQTEAFPYVLRPDARTAVIMHDLIHPRAAAFAAQGALDSASSLSRDEEATLLGRAEAVVAIQAEEAEEARRLAPASRVLVVPMTAEPVDSSQPGDDRRILFVGSNTAANLVGLQWFFANVWPRVRAASPDAELMVLGSVCRRLEGVPPGVRRLGVVDRLEPHYAAAGIVISPLTMGSGLKIKLVEALAQGKACVVTSTTLQGIPSDVAAAVRLADSAEDFARAIVELLADAGARTVLGEKALRAVRRHFSAAAAHAPLEAWLKREPDTDEPETRWRAVAGA